MVGQPHHVCSQEGRGLQARHPPSCRGLVKSSSILTNMAWQSPSKLCRRWLLQCFLCKDHTPGAVRTPSTPPAPAVWQVLRWTPVDENGAEIRLPHSGSSRRLATSGSRGTLNAASAPDVEVQMARSRSGKNGRS